MNKIATSLTTLWFGLVSATANAENLPPLAEVLTRDIARAANFISIWAPQGERNTWICGRDQNGNPTFTSEIELYRSDNPTPIVKTHYTTVGKPGDSCGQVVDSVNRKAWEFVISIRKQ